jgi:hypothetical protein
MLCDYFPILTAIGIFIGYWTIKFLLIPVRFHIWLFFYEREVARKMREQDRIWESRQKDWVE